MGNAVKHVELHAHKALQQAGFVDLADHTTTLHAVIPSDFQLIERAFRYLLAAWEVISIEHDEVGSGDDCQRGVDIGSLRTALLTEVQHTDRGTAVVLVEPRGELQSDRCRTGTITCQDDLRNTGDRTPSSNGFKQLVDRLAREMRSNHRRGRSPDEQRRAMGFTIQTATGKCLPNDACLYHQVRTDQPSV